MPLLRARTNGRYNTIVKLSFRTALPFTHPKKFLKVASNPLCSADNVSLLFPWYKLPSSFDHKTEFVFNLQIHTSWSSLCNSSMPYRVRRPHNPQSKSGISTPPKQQPVPLQARRPRYSRCTGKPWNLFPLIMVSHSFGVF